MEKTSIQYIKEAANKLVNSKLQELGEAKTQEIFKGVMQTVGLETQEEVFSLWHYSTLRAKTEPPILLTCQAISDVLYWI